MQIASILIDARAGRAEAVAAAVAALPGVEVHHVEGDRLVCTVESATEHDGVDRVSAIEGLRDVLATHLVEHHVLERREAPPTDPVPAFLRD